MTTIQVSRANPAVKMLLAASYPEYRGRKIRVTPFVGPMRLDSYWDEGSRTYFVFVDISTGRSINVHSNHPIYERGQPNLVN